MTGPSCAKIYASALRRVGALGLPRDAKVLDAPCGEGELVLGLADAGFEVSGADICADLNPAARARLGDRFRVADLNQGLPWPDASFDLVVSTEGIEHLENAAHFLRELHRILKPGGPLVLTTPNIVQLRSRMRFFWSGFYNQDPRPLNESARHALHHIGLRTFPELRYLLHTSGFRLLDAGCTHTKPVSYVYGIFAPAMWLYTRMAMRKEKNPVQRERNREILRALISPALLFGECLMLTARRD